MRRFRWIALQGNSRGFLPPLLLFYFITTSGTPAFAADVSAACSPSVARVVSIQGSIELLRARQNDWAKVTRLDTSLCEGDRLRTGALSRAALFIQPETLVRVDQNTSISVSQTKDETLVEFTQEDVLPAAAGAYSCGAGYFITRFPRKFRVNTPHLNAAVEGTEFLVAMRCESTELSVFEGKVQAAGAGADVFPARSISSGQVLTIGGSEPPAIKLLVKPADAVQWVLYYPPLSDATAEADLPPSDQCRSLPTPLDQTCLTQRAEVLLRLGRVDEAQREVDEAVALDPGRGDGNALRAIISIARNDKAGAIEAATAATLASPNSFRAWLALSYAQQASFNLEDSLSSARKAQALEPNSSVTNARVAELLMSLGRIKDAEVAARAAVDANPAESRAHTVLGFVRLAQINTKAARADFETAIERDSSDPLPRLGLGLAIIRTGKLSDGREQLEISVSLDPTNSLLRSYVGKAYYEENNKERDQLAATQFDLAKQLDRNDPTPWFYAAILMQSQNQLVEALRELQQSIERNENRAVYRSRLLLDDDIAARNASRAAIYKELGFEKLAIGESAAGIADDFGNHSAHRLLAEAYSNLPRHDIARVSEALQAQIRQPLSLPWVTPLVSTDSLLMLTGAGPSRLGANEFDLLFNRNQTRVQFDAMGGNHKTFGDQLVVSRLGDRAAFSISQLAYETEGFVANDAAEKAVYDFFVQGQVSPRTSVQFDLKRSDFEVGQTFFAFDPTFATPTTINERSDAFRFSGRYQLDSGDDWIWNTIVEDRDRAVESFPDGALFTDSDTSSYTAEVQRLSHFGNVQAVVGLGYIDENEHFGLEQVDVQTQGTNTYIYAQWRPTGYALNIQAGLAAEWFRLTNSFFPNPVERGEISPKIGLVWSPLLGTTIRAAAFSSVRRPFIRSQTIEPTQIAGFNQFFTGFEQFYGDVEGTISKRIGVALDQALSRTAYAGVEIASRRLEVPSIILDQDFVWRETTGHVYLYKTFKPFAAWQAALSVETEYEKVERPQILTGAEGIVELRTLRAPINVRLFSTRGTTLQLGSTYVKQEGIFSLDVGFPLVPTEDDAWITDVSVEHKMQKRLGVFLVGVGNIFDKSIDLLEIDPLNPRVATRQFVYGKVRLRF